MNCIQCRRALDLSTGPSGVAASCLVCGIEQLSLGRLMLLSDSQLTHRIWDLIHSDKLRSNWKSSGACPRCEKPTIGIPFRQGGEEHAIIACSDCHFVVMKKTTLELFRQSNAAVQEKRLTEARALAHAKLHAELDRDLETAKRLVLAGVDRAEYLLNDTPLREIRVTVLTAVAALALGLFTMLMPYTAMEIFGGPSATALLAAFTHVTFFQLAWNLLFFLPLGAAAEREMGPLRFSVTFGITLVLASGFGRILSPFPGAAQIGLSPLVAALIGRGLVLGTPLRFRTIRFDIRTVSIVFFASEFRTMIPTSGGMRWFTLSACVVAAVTSAAIAEYYRKKFPTPLRTEGGLARTGAKSPAKRAA